jgi:NAD(P)-dependent dehydrogenase (short-subunit alcohol dehydrogenase family)
MLSDFQTNSLGPLVLFKRMTSLLTAANEASPGSAKFMVVSSLVGSIAELLPYPYTAYSTSKAAVNFVVAKINQEYQDIVSFPIRYVFLSSHRILDSSLTC